MTFWENKEKLQHTDRVDTDEYIVVEGGVQSTKTGRVECA